MRVAVQQITETGIPMNNIHLRYTNCTSLRLRKSRSITIIADASYLRGATERGMQHFFSLQLSRHVIATENLIAIAQKLKNYDSILTPRNIALFHSGKTCHSCQNFRPALTYFILRYKCLRKSFTYESMEL